MDYVPTYFESRLLHVCVSEGQIRSSDRGMEIIEGRVRPRFPGLSELEFRFLALRAYYAIGLLKIRRAQHVSR